MQTQKAKAQCCTSPKTAFVIGIMVGLAIFSLIAFVLLALAVINVRSGVAPVKKAEAPKNNAPSTPTAPQGMEAKIIGQVGTFSEVSEPICKENGKPAVYMFSTSWCPHCQWAQPSFEKAAKKFVQQGKIVAHNWELDTNDDTLTSAKETAVPADAQAIYEKYNPQGSIPTFVFGCKYYRIGTGYERTKDTAAEEKEFEDIIGKLLK